MPRHHYREEDLEFNKFCEANPDFAPRAQLFLTERESEQNAYFWFQAGRNVELKNAVSLVSGIRAE